MRLQRCSAGGCFIRRYPFGLRQTITATFCRLVLYSLSVVCILAYPSAHAQAPLSSSVDRIPLPDAPIPVQATGKLGSNDPQQVGTGEISGTVLDTNGDVLEGAHVTLSGSAGFNKRTVVTGSDGQFAFTGLPPVVYKIAVSGQGMSNFASSPIPLRANQAFIVPQIALAVSGGSTSVTVSGNKEELAEEQVRIAVQQRVVGIFPNFYSSYDWNAPPMEARQKIQLGIRSVFDPVSFLGVAAIAGAEQYENVFPAYGSGIEGYGKRYGAALATHVSADLLSRAVYPAIFHQDPRYFYKGNGSHPVARAVCDICRRDGQRRRWTVEAKLFERAWQLLRRRYFEPLLPGL